MKSIAALAFLIASAAFVPGANAQSVIVRVDTPEFGIRIGNIGGYGVVGYPAPVYPAPVYAPPVIVAPRPLPIYAPAPPRVIVAPPVYVPAPVFYPYPRGYGFPPGHYRHDNKHHRYDDHRDSRGYYGDDGH